MRIGIGKANTEYLFRGTFIFGTSMIHSAHHIKIKLKDSSGHDIHIASLFSNRF